MFTEIDLIVFEMTGGIHLHELVRHFLILIVSGYLTFSEFMNSLLSWRSFLISFLGSNYVKSNWKFITSVHRRSSVGWICNDGEWNLKKLQSVFLGDFFRNNNWNRMYYSSGKTLMKTEPPSRQGEWKVFSALIQWEMSLSQALYLSQKRRLRKDSHRLHLRPCCFPRTT